MNPGLHRLTLHRVLELQNEAIEAMVEHSGPTLRVLDLHSVDEVEEGTLMKVAEGCPRLRELDLSFVRSADNFVVKKCLEEMSELRKIFVHGCNRVTDDCPQRVSPAEVGFGWDRRRADFVRPVSRRASRFVGWRIVELSSCRGRRRGLLYFALVVSLITTCRFAAKTPVPSPRSL